MFQARQREDRIKKDAQTSLLVSYIELSQDERRFFTSLADSYLYNIISKRYGYRGGYAKP